MILKTKFLAIIIETAGFISELVKTKIVGLMIIYKKSLALFCWKSPFLR